MNAKIKDYLNRLERFVNSCTQELLYKENLTPKECWLLATVKHLVEEINIGVEENNFGTLTNPQDIRHAVIESAKKDNYRLAHTGTEVDVVKEVMTNANKSTRSRLVSANRGTSTKPATAKFWVGYNNTYPRNFYMALYHVNTTSEGICVTKQDEVAMEYIIRAHGYSSLVDHGVATLEIRKALAAISKDDPSINADMYMGLILRRFHLRKTVADIAKCFNMPESKVNSILIDAMDKLYKYFEEGKTHA